MNAVDTFAPTAADTDWAQIVRLYDQLARLDPSPVVRLNRAVAVAEVDGPLLALAAIARLDLDGYHAFRVARADLLRRLGRSAEARTSHDRAIELSVNPAERAYLTRRRDQLGCSARGETVRLAELPDAPMFEGCRSLSLNRWSPVLRVRS